MKPLPDAWLIQIEVTTACRLTCAHCTRGVPHVARPAFGDLGFVEKALASLKGWSKGVGCTGGEPTLHPRFVDICQLYNRHFPRRQCGLWTSGGPGFEKHRHLIDRTFGIINYNDHEASCFHHPILLASEEAIPDVALRQELIDQCWVQLHWSPILTPRGAFFCEVAATLDHLLGGPGGYPIAPNWWRRDVQGFADQRDRYCGRCSMPIPLEPLPDDHRTELVSPGNAERMRAAGAGSRFPLVVVSPVFTREDIASLRAARSRPSRFYAEPDGTHSWSRIPLQAWWWKRAKYHYLPGGMRKFWRDTLRFLAIRVRDQLLGDHPVRSGRNGP